MLIKFQKCIFTILAIASIVLGLSLLPSCNVTRKVETKSQFYQSGDTTIQIVTKTTESYDASKKLSD